MPAGDHHQLDAVRAVTAAALGTDPHSLSVEATTSPIVFRVHRPGGEWFVRLAEEAGETLEVDARLLQRLRALGIRVPRPVHAEPTVEALERSVLVTEAIGGEALFARPDHPAAVEVARASGRDLARINTIAVDGFGWVDRSPANAALGRLAGVCPTYADFVVDDLPSPWPGAFAELFSAGELDRLHVIVEEERRRPVEQGALAHGDFCVEHVFHRDGDYTGIIDFGELRGTEPLFDLGVLAFTGIVGEGRVRSIRRTPLYDAFLAGYAEVSPLPDDADARILTAGLLKWLRHLGMWLRPRFPHERPAAATARWIAGAMLPAAEAARAGR